MIEDKLKKEAWLGDPEIIRWFYSQDINCAYGTIINSSDKIIEGIKYQWLNNMRLNFIPSSTS